MFTPVGSLLTNLPRRSKIPDAMVAIFVRKAFSESLRKLCGDLPAEILAKVGTQTFRNGTLTVNAPSLLATELSMRSRGLTQDINGRLGRKVVVKIKFRNI